VVVGTGVVVDDVADERSSAIVTLVVAAGVPDVIVELGVTAMVVGVVVTIAVVSAGSLLG
jgi:hypothetical protein